MINNNLMKIINDKIIINNDYSKIKDKIDIKEQVSQKSKFNIKKLKYTILIITLLFTFTFAYFYIGNLISIDVGTGSGVSPMKSAPYYYLEKYDKFFAYNWENSGSMLISSKELLNSNLISENNKKEIRKFNSKHRVYYFNGCYKIIRERYYIIEMGIINGKDIIAVSELEGGTGQPSKDYIFESTLDYSFTSKMKHIEQLIGFELTDEFLTSNEYKATVKFDHHGTKRYCDSMLVGGIALCFEEEEGKYNIYYRIIHEGTTYIFY